MKATDLIHKGLYKLGDKYILFNALNGFVYEILDGGYGKCLGDVYEDTENNALIVALSEDSCEEIQPITLTKEILEKNGFKKLDLTIGNYALFLKENGKYDIRSLLFGGVFDGRIDIENLGSYVCVRKKFSYVHELLLALRLCGLNDLANNLKLI